MSFAAYCVQYDLPSFANSSQFHCKCLRVLFINIFHVLRKYIYNANVSHLKPNSHIINVCKNESMINGCLFYMCVYIYSMDYFKPFDRLYKESELFRNVSAMTDVMHDILFINLCQKRIFDQNTPSSKNISCIRQLCCES